MLSGIFLFKDRHFYINKNQNQKSKNTLMLFLKLTVFIICSNAHAFQKNSILTDIDPYAGILIEFNCLCMDSPLQVIGSTLTVYFLEKQLQPPPAKHIPIQKLHVVGLLTIIVEPCTWCTRKFLEPFQRRPCNVKRLQR